MRSLLARCLAPFVLALLASALIAPGVMAAVQESPAAAASAPSTPPAQPPADSPPSEAPSPVPAEAIEETEVAAAIAAVPGLEPEAEIRRRLEALRRIESPSEEDKARIERLQQVLDAIGRTSGLIERAEENRDLVVQLQQRLERARTPAEPPAPLAEDATLDQLEQVGRVATAEVAAARDAVTQVDALIAQLAERRRTLPEELARARSSLTESQQAADGLPIRQPGGTDSTRQLALSKVLENRAQIMVLETELAALDARGQLLAAQREMAQARLALAEARSSEIRNRIDLERRRVAEAAEAAARVLEAEPAATVDPRLLEARQINLEIATASREANQQLTEVRARIESHRAEFQRIDRLFKVDKERAEVAGTTGEISAVLRSQREALPSLRRLATESVNTNAARIRTDLALINWRLQLDELAAEEAAAKERPQSEALLEVLAERRTSLLPVLIATMDDLSGDLGKLAKATTDLTELVTSFRNFIDERILWARSGPPVWSLQAGDVQKGWTLVRQLLGSPASWSSAWNQVMGAPFWAIVGLGLAFVLLVTRPIQNSMLIRLAGRVSRGSSDRFALTLEALGITLCQSMAVPIAMVGVGLSLRASELAPPFALALGSTLLTGAWWVALLLLVYRLVGRQGVAAEHFGWRQEQIELLRRSSIRLFWVSTPFLLFAVMLSQLTGVERSAAPTEFTQAGATGVLRSVISISFLPVLAILFWSAWRLFAPSRGLLSAHIAQNPNGWVAKFRIVWFLLIISVPASAFMLTLLGWGYTSGVLTRKYINSAILALAVVVVEAIFLRALEFAARSMANQWREKLLEAAPTVAGVDQAQKQDVRTEVAALSRKTRSTIKGLSMAILFGGLLIIWSDLLPALRVLDTWWLWEGAHGPVSFGALLSAAAIAVVAIFAAKNLPGAVEVLILQHTGMSPAGRYATSSVMGYCIVFVGILTTASWVGISWQSVQWLVAAVGVGIGFGLQEIVGNFIAGLIVLLEQPVRVGDVVTVGDKTGQIVRIRIRSTTIRDWDGKDLILPNKHLITERVVNWTLSGAPLRLSLPIGVAYGTDLALAEKILLECARSMPHVIATPPPNAQLMGFGNSSIDFELRCHVGRLEHLNPTRHALMIRIQSAFDEAGVTIAFPQLDIHVEPAAVERFTKEVNR
ncbi:MAG: mechanosensitive ion channel [Phycisphaeraceae bacterium]|nr:mechanosensitive ion channel [Phycisphaeraceae bacterium]